VSGIALRSLRCGLVRKRVCRDRRPVTSSQLNAPLRHRLIRVFIVCHCSLQSFSGIDAASKRLHGLYATSG